MARTLIEVSKQESEIMASFKQPEQISVVWFSVVWFK